MPANSTAAFLDIVLRDYSSSHPDDVSRATLDDFCRHNQPEFFTICKMLFFVILLNLHNTPAPNIHKRVLETIANDLSAIVHPLWMARQGTLKNYVVKARNLASSASKLNDGPRRNEYIMKCSQELETAHAFVSGI